MIGDRCRWCQICVVLISVSLFIDVITCADAVYDFEVTPGSSHGGEWSRLAGYWVNMVASLLSRRNRNQQQSKKNQVMMTDEIEEDEQIQIEEKAAVTERRNDQLHFVMYYMRG